jgi:hypothetical protein
MPLNLEKLQSVVREKITRLVLERITPWGEAIDLKIEIEITDDFIFATSHCKGSNMTATSHLYGVYVFSALAFDLYYRDSNIIDDQFFVSLQEVKQRANNFFEHYAKEMKKYL